jgi:hypothetical protein
LDPITRKGSAPTSATIDEEKDDDEAWAGFVESSAVNQATPPPAQPPGDMVPTKVMSDSVDSYGGNAIEEGKDEEEDDEFGNFAHSSTPGQLDIPPPAEMKRQETPMPGELRPDLPAEQFSQQLGLGSIGESGDEAGEDEEMDVDFENFGSFEQAQEVLQQSASVDNDSFSGFAAFTSAPGASVPPANDANLAETNEDSFSDFAAFTAAPAPVSAPSLVPVAAPAAPPIEPSPDESFGDFAAFEDATVAEGDRSIQQLQEEIVSLSTKLPRSFLESADVAKLFDAMVGRQSSLSTDQHRRAQRAVQVLSLMSSSHSKLASEYWEQVMGVARDELTHGKSLLEEASTLSSQEKQLVKHQLEVFVGGLGEYVRATRSMLASFGDMLLLDLSTPLSAANSAWASIPLVRQSLDVEKLWEEVLAKASTLGLQRITTLEKLEEIRSKCLALCPPATLCNFSLQPLSPTDHRTTKATVDWGGKKYMACSANLLANKCPFYVND